MDRKTVNSCSYRIYIGGRVGYTGRSFRLYDVVEEIQEFQKSRFPNYCTTRISQTTYVAHDYTENGYEIALINYPRFPKSALDTHNFAVALGEHLLLVFGQNRITIEGPHRTTLLENGNVELDPNST